MEHLKQIIRNVGEAGIPVFGYNFSLARVSGRHTFHDARGGAETVGMQGIDNINTTPVPKGMVWNMIYDSEAAPGAQPQIAHEALWPMSISAMCAAKCRTTPRLSSTRGKSICAASSRSSACIAP